MRKFSSIFLSLVLIILILTPFIISSEEITFGPYTKSQSISDVFKSIQNFAYLFLIPLTIIVVLIGAFQFLTSAGAPDKTAKAKQILFYGAIGLAVVILAAALPSILMNLMGIEKPITEVTTPTPTSFPTPPPGWPTDPEAALSQYLSEPGVDTVVGVPSARRSEIDNLFGF